MAQRRERIRVDIADGARVPSLAIEIPLQTTPHPDPTIVGRLHICLLDGMERASACSDIRGCMDSALTGAQLEILRRVRDGVELTAPPMIPGMITELGFLHAFELVEFRRTFDVGLTEFGRAYLAKCDRDEDLQPQSEV